MPARVVVGMALVSENGSHAAFGHAWAEVREQDRWVVADAALHGAAAEVRYVPYGVLTDEGPGYTLGLARLSVVWAQRVVVLGSARVNP
jgi:transglutaminase-like putative cysteine protease